MQRDINWKWLFACRMIQILFCMTACAFWIFIPLRIENEMTVFMSLLRVVMPAIAAVMAVLKITRYSCSDRKLFRGASSLLMVTTGMLHCIFLLNISKPIRYHFGHDYAAAVMNIGLPWALVTAIIEMALEGQDSMRSSGK